MSRALQAALARLLQTDAGQVAASQLTIAQRQALEQFGRRTAAVRQQRSGRGVVYRLMDRGVVQHQLRELAPLTIGEMDDQLPARAANIGRSRSSKQGEHRHEVYHLLLRAVGAAFWRTDCGHVLDLQRDSQYRGGAMLAIGGDSHQSWHTDSELWLVENQALFDRPDWLPTQQPATVAWYGGHLRNSLIDWLAERPRAAHIRFFPDYDGVGLQNYLRIRRRLGDRVSFWLIPDWERRLHRYGNNALWQGTAREFRAAIPELQPLIRQAPELQRLIRAMQTSGLALEQEAVWL